jgi:Plasmid encoded RepA protein
MHPETGKWVKLAIPFGPKPRLILTHLNREALIHASPEIEVEYSLTAFMKRILGFDPNGKEIRKFKDQLTRLAASMIRLAVIQGDRAFQIDTKVVTAFDLWFPKDQRQRVLWPSTVHLSLDYFESLQCHAVPLDERAVAALSHSAMGLDIYAWLAQRLHRVDPGRPGFIPWNALKEQFGHQYGRMDNFKRVFRHTVDMVLTQYRAARIELDGRGMTLRNSPPPINGRIALIRRA